MASNQHAMIILRNPLQYTNKLIRKYPSPQTDCNSNSGLLILTQSPLGTSTMTTGVQVAPTGRLVGNTICQLDIYVRAHSLHCDWKVHILCVVYSCVTISFKCWQRQISTMVNARFTPLETMLNLCPYFHIISGQNCVDNV